MRKRAGVLLKQGLAVMMSLSMAFGPCAPGIRPVFGAQAEVEISEAEEAGSVSDSAADEAVPVQQETASASDASVETASASDALVDEDGLLMDGTVFDDVTVATGSDAELEIIAPEMKTEVIGKKEAGPPAWLKDYAYTLNVTKGIITLNCYEGTDSHLVVPASATINGRTYKVEFDPYGSIWSYGEVVSISFEDGMIMPEDMSYLFLDCSKLEHLDISGIDVSAVKTMRGLFAGCHSLTDLDLSGWDTTNVTDMADMFSNCYGYELDVLWLQRTEGD